MAICLVSIIPLAAFRAQSLAVLTVIYNFDIRRADGITAAPQLFGYYARESI